MFEYDAESMAAAEILDKYDLSDTLRCFHGVDIYEVIDNIDNLGIDEVTDAIHNLTTDEFATYLEKHYKMRSEEVIRYAVWWGRE